jgi:integrase
MASIVRRRGAKVWTAFFRDIHGKQYCRSTGARDKKTAQKIADEFEAAAVTKRSQRQASRVLSEMHALLGGPRAAESSLRVYTTSWLESKCAETKPATYSFYSQSCGRFLSFLGEAADQEISQVTKVNITAYRAQLALCVSANTANHHMVVVRMLFRSARRDGLIVDDPSEFVGSVRETSPQTAPRRAFTVAELEAVLAVADPEWQSMVLFGLYSALRLMDVARLTWANIDLTRNELRVTTAKTGKAVILPLAAPLRAHIDSLPSADSLDTFIHPRASQAGGGPILSGQFALLLVHAGLREPRAVIPPAQRSARKPQHELSFHSLRHTAASMLHASGIAQATAQAFTGHSSTVVHGLYVHTDRESLQRAAAALPNIRRENA